MNLKKTILLSLLLLGGALQIQAQITWGQPLNIGRAGASEVSAIGTLNYAYDWGNSASVTINGVTFTQVTSDAGNANVGITGVAGGVDHTGEGTGAAGSPYYALTAAVSSYVPLIQGTAWGGTGAGTVTLNGLTAGHNYQVQVWMNDSRGGGESGRNTTLASTGGNSVTLAYNAVGNLNEASSAGNLGQFVIGTFTANGASQSFTLTPGGMNPGAQINSIQVRDITSVVSAATSGIWTNVISGGDWSAGGNWAAGTAASGATATANFATLTLGTDPTVVHLDTATITVGNLDFGDFSTNVPAGWVLDNNGTPADLLTLAGNTPTITVNALDAGQVVAISAQIAGSAGLIKAGAGQLSINGTAASTYAGVTAVNSGTLLVDFSNAGSTTPANLLNSASPLFLAGGAFQINGSAATANSQSVGGTTISAGNNVISVGGIVAPTLALGALYQYAGSTLDFVGPATIGAGNAPVAAAGTITTTTQNGVASNLGLMWGPGRAAPATVGLYDWASTYAAGGSSTSSPYTIIGGSQVAGFYVTLASGNLVNNDDNVDITETSSAPGSTQYADTIRFNTPSPINFSVGGGHGFLCSGVLVTPNVGANNITISAAAGGDGIAANNSGNTTQAALAVYQNNLSGELVISASVLDYGGTARTTVFAQAGAGTVVLSGVNTYSQSTFLNGGSTVVSADSAFGAVADGSPVTLNGGTAVGGATFTMDNGSTIKRPFILGPNGGGLAALGGFAMTLDGVIGGASGSGPLTIGIAASSANGGAVGLLPGTGGSSPNPAAYATGLVVLSGANTYPGGTILQSGTLTINGINALGGANYGGVTFDGGTLQYLNLVGSPDITQNSAGAPQTVTLAGNATIDVNANTVIYANPVGNSGAGSLTVTNSGSPGVGGLFMNGGSSYTGGTTVAAGAVLGGTNTLAGNVTWTTGSYASLIPNLPLTVSGTVTLNNPTVQVTASGLTTGTYTLLTATGGITGGSTVNPVPAGSGVVAGGYGGTVSISGNSVILTVAQLGVSDTWTDGNGDQNWSELGNWGGGLFVPQNPGDSATFGTGGAGSPVNLNQNETVGTLTFDSPGSYTITNAVNTLTLDNKGNPVGVTVTAGTANAINAAVALNGNVTATVGAGDSLTLGGTIANESVPETLTVAGGGTVVLAGANTYGPAAGGTVGTTLGGATVQVGSNASLGAGDVSVTANSTLSAGAAGLNLANNLAVANTHTLTVANNGNNVALTGVVSGNGALATAGTGTLTVGTANNTYAGGTILNAGILGISADGAAAGGAGSLGAVPASATPNNLIFTGGDLLATATLTLQTNRGLGIGSTATANTATTTAFIDAAAGQTLTIDGVIASAGNTGTNSLTVNSEPGSTGTVVLGGADTFNGTNIIVAGEEQLASPLALQFSTLFYNNQGGVLDFGAQTAATLGGLIGAQNLTLVNDSAAAVALTIGNYRTPALYAGLLGDNGSGASLTINGSGVQQIGSGANGGAAYTGATTLNQGSLILGGNTVLTGAVNLTGLNGACNLTVQDQAMITSSGELYLASAGGNNYPGICTLTLLGNADVSAPAFSFGETSRVPGGCFVTIAGNSILNIAGDFELEDAEGSTAQNNVVNLNGGTLGVGNFTLSYATAGTHQATLNFNGGVLQANAGDNGGTDFLPALTALTVNVLTNGVLINPNNYSITIAATLTGAGGLTNLGLGTLNLAGANTYAGGTEVSNNAVLNVINTTGSATGAGKVTVLSGGTLEGTGIITGNVVWQTGALASFTAGSTPTPLTVGVVALSNNPVIVNVPNGTPLAIGSYTLMNYTAAGSTGAFNPTPAITGAGANGVGTISTGGGVVTLRISPNVTYDVWNVDANGPWTTPGDWSSATVPGNPGDSALLGIGSALRTVTLNANESLGYLTFSNANSFVIAGTGNTLTLDNNGNGAYVTVNGGTTNVIQTPVDFNDSANLSVSSGDLLAITGVVANTPGVTEALTFGGGGELILANANTYGPAQGSTGTTVAGGILQVGNNSALGAGDVAVSASSTLLSGAPALTLTNNFNVNSGVLTLNDNGNVFTLGGVFNGGGGLLKIGSGTLILTNNNSFSGGLTFTNGTVVLAGYYSGGDGPVTNGATLQLDNAGAASGGALVLNNGSTLQLRADTTTTFSPSALGVPNASDTLNFDAGPLTAGVTSNTLSLSGTLAYASSSDQTINVTGNSTYTLALGGITLTATSHNPYHSLFVNTLPAGPAVTIASVTYGNWGNDLDLDGGGNVTITGNLTATSNGAIDLLVNHGTTATLQGSSGGNSATSDGNKYVVENGTLVLDNSTALVNNTDGTGLDQSLFLLGSATNVLNGATYAHAAGVLTATNNSFNAAVYLGDANYYYGGLSVAANVTNYVSDGDIGFTNYGVMTIGGQNTNGVNTYNNQIILGWTPNRGKSVTLVAAPGGEVDFAGPILANGTDRTAGITVGTPAFTGLVKLYATTNTFYGPTIINYGTLALANNGNDAFIANSSAIVINAGALLDVSAQYGENATFPLGTGAIAQTLQGSGSLNGSLTVGSLGTVAPGSATALGTLTVSNNVSLGGNLVLKLNNTGGLNNDTLAVVGTLTAGGTLTVTNIGPALVPGSTFQLFPGAVTSFSNIILPVSDNNYRYVWNNQVTTLGSITLQSATMLVNTNPLTAYFKGVRQGNNSLNFTWAPDHQGWQLYTNIVGLTSANSWFPLAGSANGTNTTITINPAQPQVFFQLRYP